MQTYLAVGIIIAALWPVFLNLATGMDIYEFMFLEYLISVPSSVLLVFLFKKQKGLLEVLRNKKMLGIVALISLLNYGFQDFGMLYSEHLISPSLASVIFNSYPIMMLLFLPVLIKEKVSRYQIVALGLGFIGISIILAGGLTSSLQGVNVIGVILALGVALTTALSLSLVKRYVVDIQNAIFFFCSFSLVMFTITFFLAGMPAYPISYTEMLAVLYTGIIYSVIFGFIYYMALNTLKTTIVTNFYFLAPFLTFAFSYLFLGEQIPSYYVLTAVLISAGILIQKFDKIGGTFKPDDETEFKEFLLYDVTGVFTETREDSIRTAIKEGGRVLATKLDRIHKGLIEDLSSSGSYSKIFTERNDEIMEEAPLVRNIVHAGEGEIIVVKAGGKDDVMIFFRALSKKIKM